MVMIAPVMSNNSNNAGMAVISFDLSSTFICAKTKRCVLAQALMTWSADLPKFRS